MAPAAILADILGGQRVLGRKVKSAVAWIELIRAGLPYSALESVMKTLGLTREEAARFLSVPIRTLDRRKKQRRLRSDESDRLYRIANIAAEAVDLFESKEYAANWLRHPNLALGGVAPLALLDTCAGAAQVEEILGRIKYGGYS